MKFVIAEDTVKVDYKDHEFWQQFDEVEVQCPNGWFVRYVEGGIVHSFEYCQSSGRGEYTSSYKEDVFKKPLRFSCDAKANAELMRKTNYDGKKATLIREV